MTLKDKNDEVIEWRYKMVIRVYDYYQELASQRSVPPVDMSSNVSAVLEVTTSEVGCAHEDMKLRNAPWEDGTLVNVLTDAGM